MFVVNVTSAARNWSQTKANKKKSCTYKIQHIQM